MQGARHTFSVGFGVFKIRTAHCIRVLGGLTAGTTGSTSSVSMDTAICVCLMALGGGGGSANSFSRLVV